MSEYGATLYIKKRFGAAFLRAEKMRVKDAVEKIEEEVKFTDYIGDESLFDAVVLPGQPHTMWVRLSEYWEDEDAGFEQAGGERENDMPQAEKVAQKLQVVLGMEYEVTAAFEEW